jgi:tetratricopeptide (TPR) repeat protein
MTDSAPPERPDYFKNSVIVMLTLISVFVALVTLLQSYAGLQSSDLAQRSSFNAVNATGLLFRAGLSAAQGVDVLQRHEDYLQRAVRADTKARALRMGGQAALAAGYALDTDRWRAAAESVRQSDPLLVEYGGDAALFREELARPAYLEEEDEYILLDQSRVWSQKANGFVAVISTLSVSLFLAGLSLTLGSRLKFLLALASLGLTVFCVVWVLVIIFRPVPFVPGSAIENFVEGRIQYNLARSRGEDPALAREYFDAAVAIAPDYGRALFYRSLANTDASLLDKRLDTQRAIDDALRAIQLGNQDAPVFGNLGWLYYLNGQYRRALEYTERAWGMAPDDCYLSFNRGLIYLALQQPVEADSAYTVAIDCAQRQSSDATFNYLMESGVLDLAELSAARPDLGDTLDPAVVRLKQAFASLRMYGEVRAASTPARFEPIVFGANVTAADEVIDLADEYPQSATIVYARLAFEGMQPNSRWMTRWVLDGREYFSRVYDEWVYAESGTAWVSLFNYGGLNSGTYDLDVFVDGALVSTGRLHVLPGDLPPMTYFASSAVGATISYPVGWRYTDLADNEVSVIAARDPESEDFFGVTAWVASTETDADVFQLFELYLDALDAEMAAFSAEQRQPTTLAQRQGWRNAYAYTNAAGVPIRGVLAGFVDPSIDLTYIAVIESRASEWDAKAGLFNVMLARLLITR